MNKIAIIGGSGFGEGFASGAAEIVATEYGPAALTRAAVHGDSELIFLSRHGAGHSIPPHRINHRANIAALKSVGADAVLATAAVGSLRLDLAPGHFVVMHDLIDMTKGDMVTYFDQSGLVRHTDMSRPYDPALRKVLIDTAPGDAETAHSNGVYLCVSGPRYETPAEIRLFASWGADVVGMTSAPEAILCREMGIPYAVVGLVTNYGCGITDQPLSHAEVEEQMALRRGVLRSWLIRAVDALVNGTA